MNISTHRIVSHQPAPEWAEGYPIGNGRIGAMVLGDSLRERVTLNHDRLWRNFWTFQTHDTAADLPQLRRLIADGKWEEAHALMIQKIPVSSQALYLNPFAPACDLGIYPWHGASEVTGYERSLDLDEAVAKVSYEVDGVRYHREYLTPWAEGVLVIRLSASQAGRLRGQVTLSRFLDPDCVVTGSARLGEVVLEGRFEEGVPFAAVVRVVQRGGRLTAARSEYVPPAGPMPPPDLNGGQFIFRENDYPHDPIGVSTGFDCADEVLLFVTVATRDETDGDLVEWGRQKLASIPADFAKLRAGHVRDHQELYRRTSLRLGATEVEKSTAELIAEARRTPDAAPAALIETLFNMGRYLAIASGRPVPAGQAAKAPINLQGLWNQDRRPPWDSDYHLDLNLQMCYWPLSMANLGELMEPMADWFLTLLPQARQAAQDLYGCRGAVWSGVCELRNLGNVDDICFPWTGAGAWVAQLLWQHWEYSGDREFLRAKLYPLLAEIGLFYEDYLIADEEGRLVPVPSCSPEMGIKGRSRYSTISSPSSMDLELIGEIFTHLLTASETLSVDEPKRGRWQEILGRLPQLPISPEGCLQEWMLNHEPIDVGHRHRSPLVGLCPGDRLTAQNTPGDFSAARKLLAARQSDRASTCAFAVVWDAQLLARFYEGDDALKELALAARTWLMNNGLLSICDWHEDASTLNWFPDRKVFQVEASIGAVASITEMLFQDRRGVLHFLPALPVAWTAGELRGACSRGGFLLDLVWEDGKLHTATLRSLRGEACRLRNPSGGGKWTVSEDDRPSPVSVDGDVTRFFTQAGKTYTIRPDSSAG